MKLLFALIFLVFTIVQTSFGQNFDYGRIISKNGGKCATIGIEGQSPTFQTCNSVVGQIINYNIGDNNSPTFFIGNKCLTAVSGTTITILPSNPSLQNQWSVRNTGDNEFYIINNNYDRCLNHWVSDDGLSSSVTIEPCVPGAVQQLFTFQSTSPVSNRVTYDALSIPLTTGLFLDSQGINGPTSSYQGMNYPVAGYSLRLDADCVLRVRSQGEILWTSGSSYSGCKSSASIKVFTTGNVCIFPSEDAGVEAIWCTGTSGTNGRYFTLIPPYSYGRKFGLVLLNSAQQMVWGRFGAPVTKEAGHVLIPGNYLDAMKPSSLLIPNRFITSGSDYLFLGQDGRLQVAKNWIGSSNSQTNWITGVPTSSQTGPYSFQAVGNKYCLTSSSTQMVCLTDNSRYVQLPVYTSGDTTHWGFLTLDIMGSITGGFFNKPQTSSEYVVKPNIINNGISTNAIDLSILEGGSIKITNKFTNLVTYPTLGPVLSGANCGDAPTSYWQHKGMWISDGFQFANYISYGGPLAPYCVGFPSETIPYLNYVPSKSDNTYLVAGTIFQEIFMLNGDGKINFHYSY